MRAFIEKDPFLHLNQDKVWREQGQWPCSWISHPDPGNPPFVVAYRKRFSVAESASIRIHVTADERYELFLDGDRIGRGPERGSPDDWFYETCDLGLEAGEHIFVARVWSLGDQAAEAQMSVEHGFLLAPEGKWMSNLGTGVALWEAKLLGGYQFDRPEFAHWKGSMIRIDGKEFSWNFENGEGEDWVAAQVNNPGVGRRIDWSFRPLHLLQPAQLPPMLDIARATGIVRLVADVPSLDTRSIPVHITDHIPDETDWKELIRGSGNVTIPPYTRRRVIIDLQNYYCAYPELVTEGGAGSMIRVLWAEGLYSAPEFWRGTKGNRDEIEGKYFIGQGDTFLPEGGSQRKYETLWWQAGRYIEITVQTEAQSLTIVRFRLRETRYPLEMESSFNCSDPRMRQTMPVLIRGMQMCSNETFFDCPYYEELMYTGDTRLEALTTYIMTRDDRLPRKALRLFDSSRLASGLTQSRYPCRIMQIIAPFSLWWVVMVRDYALWRDDRAFVQALMPGVVATLEGFGRFLGSDGLLQAPEGWNTIDWVPAWDKDAGIPPDGINGVSGLLNWQLVYVLSQTAYLEAQLGDILLAERTRQQASNLAKRAMDVFWDEERGLLADDRSKQHFSEHTQCLAILSGMIDPEYEKQIAQGLLTDPDLERTTIYFSFYLFETYRELGRIDALFNRLPLWFNLVQQGLKTPLESPEPSRSDCHAWGSHPLYHYFATILGIRPGGLGFHTVDIAPQLGPLSQASGRLVHPAGGEIEVNFHIENDMLRGSVTLPNGLSGTLKANRQTFPLHEGKTNL